MKVLVLGATGLIGINLVQTLIKLDCHVRTVGREDIKTIPEILYKTEYFSLDINNVSDFNILLKNIDIVFYLVSTTNPNNSELNRVVDMSDNVIPSIKFFDACVQNNIKKLFFYSSGGTVYGEPKEHIPLKETESLHPICSYGIQKLTIESYLHLYRVHYGLDSYILRIANPYDLNFISKNGVGVVSIFYNKIKNKQPINLMGNGNIIRDYIALSDLSIFIEKILSYSGEFRIFNVATGVGTSLNQIVSGVESVLNIPALINYSEKRLQDVTYNVLNIERAIFELQWSPLIKLSDSINSFL